MERVYNKLVRDNIPKIIEQDQKICFIRELDDEDYRTELYKKLEEECQEVIDSKNPEEILEELADVFEVIKTIAESENKKIDDIIEIANQKRMKYGGFDKRIFLEKTITKE